MGVVGLSALFAGVLGVLLVSPAGAQDIHPQEIARFQGTWVMVSGTMRDTALDQDTVKNNRITFTGTRLTVQSPHQTNETIVANLTKLDPGKAPAQMDWVRSSGPHKQGTMRGIYEFQGEETYRICFQQSGAARPTNFTSAGGCELLHVWRRVK